MIDGETLRQWRAVLAGGWSPETAYPGTTPGYSRGQCGVSSIWLAHRLEAYGVDADYCIGTLLLDHAEDIADHCWLEFEGLILDVTCDQSGLDRPVAFAARSQLADEGLDYVVRVRMKARDVPPGDGVWPRYWRLLLNLIDGEQYLTQTPNRSASQAVEAMSSHD